jgi:hypothetical protein
VICRKASRSYAAGIRFNATHLETPQARHDLEHAARVATPGRE